jgi:hypothetical protein
MINDLLTKDYNQHNTRLEATWVAKKIDRVIKSKKIAWGLSGGTYPYSGARALSMPMTELLT